MKKFVFAITLASALAFGNLVSACGAMYTLPEGTIFAEGMYYVDSTSDEVQAAADAAGIEIEGKFAVLEYYEELGYWLFQKWGDEIPEVSLDETLIEEEVEVPPPPPPPMFVQATPDSFELFSDPAAVSIPEQAPPLELEETVIIS